MYPYGYYEKLGLWPKSISDPNTLVESKIRSDCYYAECVKRKVNCKECCNSNFGCPSFEVSDFD